jgi:hypothetical protein
MTPGGQPTLTRKSFASALINASRKGIAAMKKRNLY